MVPGSGGTVVGFEVAAVGRLKAGNGQVGWEVEANFSLTWTGLTHLSPRRLAETSTLPL